MKRRFTILTAALALLAFLAIPMGMRGQTTHTIGWGTASGDAGTYTNFTATSGTVTNILSFSTAKNSSNNDPAYNASNKELRLYNATNGNGCSITITPASDLTITQIVITATSGYTSDVKYSVDGGTATIAEWSNNTCTISGIEASTSLTVQNVKTSTQQLRIKTIAVTYAVDGPVTYTVTYDCNGGTAGCPDNLTGLSANTSITLANAPTKEHFNFEGWSDGTNTYDAGDSYIVNSHVTFTAQWESDGTAGEGSICFSNQSSCTAINSQSVTGEDNLGNTWTITTVGTNSFTSNSGYYQVGSGGSPATSITFTTTLDEEVNVTDFSAMFGGFNATRASVVLKVDNTQVGSGTLNGAADVTVSSSSAQIGTTLTVIVTPTAGGVKCYNISYAYETIDNPAVATTTTINVPQDFNTDIYQGTTAGTLTATVSAEGTPISGATVTWESSNTGVATIDANGAVTLVAVGTTTITANYAGVEDQYRPSTDTYELAVTDSNAPGTQNNPYTVAEAIAATPSSGNVYIQGIVSSFYNTSIVGDGNNYRYYISDDGTTTTQLLVYKGTGLNQATFQNADDLLVGDEVVICGTLTMYQNAPEINSGNYLYSWNRPSTPAQEYTLTVTASENVEIFTFAGESTDPGVEGSTTLQVYNGTEVGISVSATTGYILTLMVDGEDVTSELDDSGYYTFTMPAHNVTVSATASVAPVVTTTTYTLATSIESGKQYIIVGWANGTPYAMGYNKGNNRHAVEISVTGDDNETASATIANTEANPHEFTITSLGNGYYSIMDATTSGGYLYAAGSSNNYLKTEDALDEDKNGDWKITISDGSFSVAADQSSNRNVMQFNNSSTLFACYSSASQHPVFLYVKDETPAGNTITVTGYGNTDGGYVLLAWPESTSPADIDGMISDDLVTNVTPETSTYDLYSYDGSQEMEWRNYRKSNFNLVPGKGYLYASKEGVTLTYEGEANPEFADVDNLPYTENNLVKSLYLAGNSKTTTETFYVYDNDNNYNQIAFNYLVMNEGGNGFTSHQATSFEAQPLQGFFVQAPKANTILSTADLSDADGVSLLNLQVMRNRGTVVDNAIVSFSNGPTMKKFQLFENSTKLYIPQDNEDYAIVRSEAQGELPVSFRAAENGTYTLSMNVENVDMNYLHLIDNMTGMDIDLLQTPSYTFEANTNDYANRFKLVFAANGTDEADESSFAFFSNGNLIVNNEGNATLQVIDINGRILSSETISGSCSKAINATTGVYMLRLINGENVKVQKVVVR